MRALVEGLARLDPGREYTVFVRHDAAGELAAAANLRLVPTSARHYSVEEQWGFVRTLHRHRFDLMVFPHFNAPALYRRPYVVTIHDLTLHFFPGNHRVDSLSRLAYRALLARVTRRADHCFCVSEHTARDLRQVLRVPRERITVAYNGGPGGDPPPRDEGAAAELRRRLGLPRRYLLYTGAQSRHKNVAGLVRAFGRFLRDHPDEELDLVLAGPSPVAAPDVAAAVARLGLRRRVHLPGYVPEEWMDALRSGATAFLFPSLYEGFGLPPLEAMRCGTPVACSDRAAIPEVCGDAALYFDPQDVADMARAIERVVGDRRLRATLVARGRRRYREFSWDAMVRTMHRVYLRLLGSPPGAA